VFSGNFLDVEQAQSGAIRPFGAEKCSEDLFFVFSGNAATIISDFEADCPVCMATRA
jgi:hypothetical protein